MSEIMDLSSDDWLLKSALPGEGKRKRYDQAKAWTEGSIMATVPGNVHLDLFRNKLLPDPYFGLNSKKYKWVEKREWWYLKKFTVSQQYRGIQITMIFKGVDYAANFYLNGIFLGRHKGMFTPISFEIGDLLHYGEENYMVVQIDPPPTNRSKTVKCQMSYGWDFAVKLVTVGIWDDVFLKITDGGRIEATKIRSQLSDKFRKARVSVELKFTKVSSGSIFRVELWREGHHLLAVREIKLEDGKVEAKCNFNLQNPILWYPRGYGDQNLYLLRVCLINRKGKTGDHSETPFGIREIKFIKNKGSEMFEHEEWYSPATQRATSLTCYINGQPVYLKGTNIVPPDQFFGRINKQDYEHLIELALEANFNILRIWGGGIINKESFYELCDKYGILIWQEFPLACGNYFGDHYLKVLEKEAIGIIEKLYNHPSIILWVGGNELYNGWSGMDEQSPALRLLNAICYEKDPTRPFWPTSPIHGIVHGPYVYNIDRDVYRKGHFMEHYEVYEYMKTCFAAEFGVSSITNLPLLKKYLPEKDLKLPIKKTPNLTHHFGFGSYPHKESSCWFRLPMLYSLFGQFSCLEDLVWASQFIQSEGLRYAIEEFRRRRPLCSGSLFWCFNEPFPTAANNSVVDWSGQPKMAYYFIRKSYKAVNVSAKYEHLIWAKDEKFEAFLWGSVDSTSFLTGSRVIARILDITNHCFNKTEIRDIDIGPDESKMVGQISYPVEKLPGIFFLRLELRDKKDFLLVEDIYTYGKMDFSRNVNEPPQVPVMARLFNLLPTRISAVFEKGKIVVKNIGKNLAFSVSITLCENLPVYMNDNYFFIEPGGKKDITLRFVKTLKHLRIRIKGLNTNEITKSSQLLTK